MPASVAQEAEYVLKSLNLWRLPVCPIDIVNEEGIELAPGFYGDRFDARIEYFPSHRAFCIYHQEPGFGRTQGRVNFSIAHELGHYYLPEHRRRLREGRMHNSESDFRSDNPHEREADEFAAALLMPMELFRQEIDKFRCGVCTLDDLTRLAERLGTSITGTARRYCQCDREPCTVFFSKNGIITWGVSSTDMKYLKLYYYRYGEPPPDRSKTAELWREIVAGQPASVIQGTVDAHIWFDYPQAKYLWEEVMPLGSTGLAITQLTPET